MRRKSQQSKRQLTSNDLIQINPGKPITMIEPKLINIVGGGELDQELQLGNLSKTIEGEEVRYNPEQWMGLYIKYKENHPAILVFSSGKYNIAGAESEEQIRDINDEFISNMSELGISIGDSSFDIRNRVYMYEYDREFDLNTLSLGIGMEKTEYEPEQFPGIFYDFPDGEGTFLIFRTGKVILTGVRTNNQATESYKSLHKQINNLISRG